MPNEIKLNSTVRIRYGERAGRLATVRSVGNGGHFSHDLIAVEITAHNDPTHIVPLWIFRFALEFVSDPPPAADSLSLGEIDRPALLPFPQFVRIRRFKHCDRVRVSNRALALYGEIGMIVELFDDPAVSDGIGRHEGPFHARYKVEFKTEHQWHDPELTAGLASTFVVFTETFYDWELAPEKTNA